MKKGGGKNVGSLEKGTGFWAVQVLSAKEDPSDLVLGKNGGPWGVQALWDNALETHPE